MRKRPFLLAVSFFLAGIYYTAEQDNRVLIFLPFYALYLIIPKIKALGWNKKSLWSILSIVIVVSTLFSMGVMHMKRQIQFRETYLSKITEGQIVTILGEISKVQKSNFGYQIYMSDCYLFQNSTYIPCNQVLVYASKPQFQVGEIHKITGKINIFSNARNEGNFNSASYYKSQKIDFSIKLERTEYVADNKNWIIRSILLLKEQLGKVYDTCLKERYAGVIKGMVLGDKSTLDEEMKDLFTIAGISHILAISGLHVSVIGRGCYRALRKLGLGFLLSGILAGSVLLAYGFMTGNGVSTRRAIGMLLIYMGSQVIGRSYDMLNGLGIMCLFLLWENPFLIEYSGFWFFVTALLGVGFVGEAFIEEYKNIEQKFDIRSLLKLIPCFKGMKMNDSQSLFILEDRHFDILSIENSPLQMSRALSDEYGEFLGPLEMKKLKLISHKEDCVYKKGEKEDFESSIYGVLSTNGAKLHLIPYLFQVLQVSLYYIQKSLWSSLAVTLATLPIVAYCYFEVPILSSIINCMILPLLTPLFFCALLGGIVGLFYLPLANILLSPCEWILGVYEWICRWNENISIFVIITQKPTIEKIVFYYLILMGGMMVLKGGKRIYR